MAEESKTSLGLDENIEGALCYLAGFVSGLVFLFLEKESDFVKFHAIQSIVVFLPLFILMVFSGIIPIIGSILALVVLIANLVLWGLLMFKAYQGEKFEVPVFSSLPPVKKAKKTIAEQDL